MARRRQRQQRGQREALDLRARYLETLKLALLDVAGTSTARLLTDGTVVEVPVDSPERLNGQDWPAHGLTMVGRKRLDNLQHIVQEILRDEVKGDLLEAGVWRGGASLFMKAVLEAYDDSERHVVLADSFTGVPRPVNPGGDGADELYEFSDYLGVAREDVKRNLARYGLLDKRVEFVKGLFAQTMPRLAGRAWSVLRLDGDLYESVMPPLEHLYDGLSPGGFVIIDDYQIPQAARAALDFRERMGITDPLLGIDNIAVYWRKS